MRGEESRELDLAAPAFRRRLRARDEDAWAALYEAGERRVRMAAYRILPDRLDPEATAQQAWVRAIHRARRIDLERDPIPWVVAICVNLCITVQRRAKRMRGYMERTRHDRRTPAPAFLQLEGHRVASSSVVEGVRQLSRDQQQIIYLRFACDMGNGDIADALDVPEATVRKRLSRAYARIRRHVAENESPPERPSGP